MVKRLRFVFFFWVSEELFCESSGFFFVSVTYSFCFISFKLLRFLRAPPCFISVSHILLLLRNTWWGSKSRYRHHSSFWWETVSVGSWWRKKKTTRFFFFLLLWITWINILCLNPDCNCTQRKRVMMISSTQSDENLLTSKSRAELLNEKEKFVRDFNELSLPFSVPFLIIFHSNLSFFLLFFRSLAVSSLLETLNSLLQWKQFS